MLVAITMTAMLFAVGLAIDTGQLFVARRAAQEAADAAAYAGAVVLYQQTTLGWAVDETVATLAATTDAQRNGYVDGGSGGLDAVTVRLPPTSGPHINDHKYLEVVISTQVRTALVPNQSGLNIIRVRGVAGSEPLNNGYAIMALNRGNTPNAFSIGVNGDVHLTGGGILINSSCTGGCGVAADDTQTDHSRFTVAAPYGVDVAGTVGDVANWPTTGSGTRTGQPQRPDPFAGFPKPSTAGLTLDPAAIHSGGTLVSGIYDYKISGKKLCTGVYILKAGMGGDISRDTTAPCDGKVFIFNTLTNYPAAGGTCGAIDTGGNHDIDLQAMTTGTYANLVLYQDPACTATVNLNGSSLSVTVTGTIYLPSAKLTMVGNGMTITGGQIVADTIDVQNGNINITFASGTSAQPILPRLAE